MRVLGQTGKVFLNYFFKWEKYFIFKTYDLEVINKNTDKQDHIEIMVRNYHQHTHQKMNREKKVL